MIIVFTIWIVGGTFRKMRNSFGRPTSPTKEFVNQKRPRDNDGKIREDYFEGSIIFGIEWSK